MLTLQISCPVNKAANHESECPCYASESTMKDMKGLKKSKPPIPR
ncbi:unnamed protein product, partial [marine sediment metagenome]